MQITPTLPEPAPRPAPGMPAKASESGFAELLGQRQAAPAENTAAPDDKTPDAAPTTPAPPAADARGPRTRTAAREAAPRAGAATRHAAAKTQAEPADAADDDTASRRPADAEPAPFDPTLAHWMAGLHIPQPDTAPAAGAGKKTADTATTNGTPLTPGGKSGADPRDLALRADARPDERAGAATDRARAGSTAATDTRRESFAAEAAAAFGQRKTTPEAAQPAPRHDVDASALVAQAAAPAAAGRSDVAPTPIDVRLSTPLESPEFAQAFGVQVSVLARDGVQQAELHLNPAEMGPVSVQIVLEGTQARIDFGADAAGTRQAIEQSLPELAAALRDAGFTLSGGGVSQHAAGGDGQAGRDAPDPRRPSGRPAPDAAAAAPRRAWRGSVSAAGVDLYA